MKARPQTKLPKGQPPPPKQGPSPRPGASRSSSMIVHSGAAVPVPGLVLAMKGACTLIQRLVSTKEDLRDIKVSLIECEDLMQILKVRASQWSSTNKGRGPADTAMDALRFSATQLADLNKAASDEEKRYAGMPEMKFILSQKEAAIGSKAPSAEWQRVPYEADPGVGRAPMMLNATVAAAPQPPELMQQLVNPYSVVPNRKTIQSFLHHGNDGGAGGSGGNNSSGQLPGKSGLSAPTYAAPPGHGQNQVPSWGLTPSTPGYPPQPGVPPLPYGSAGGPPLMSPPYPQQQQQQQQRPPYYPPQQFQPHQVPPAPYQQLYGAYGSSPGYAANVQQSSGQATYRPL